MEDKTGAAGNDFQGLKNVPTEYEQVIKKRGGEGGRQ